MSTPRKTVRAAAAATVLVIAVAAVLVIAGCGSSTTPASSPTPTVTATVTASPAASPASSPATTSDTGAPSAAVMSLQSALKKAGLYTGKLTGVFNTATEDGVLRLEESLDMKGADSSYDAKTYIAQAAKGMQGVTTAFIQQVQVALQQIGFYNGKVDGVYGPKTVAAVKAFQSSVGLKADGIVGAQTIAAYEALSKGDATVAALQQQLKDWGVYSGSVDGVYGPSTVQAVKALQTALGVTPADGTWGPKTQAAVIAAHKILGKGSVVTARVQTDLMSLGYYKGDVDGVYGPQTIAAVKAFQKYYGLPVTGIVDAKTLKVLRANTKSF